MSCFEHVTAKLPHGAIFQMVQQQVDAGSDPASQVCGEMLLAKARISVFEVRNATVRPKHIKRWLC